MTQLFNSQFSSQLMLIDLNFIHELIKQEQLSLKQFISVHKIQLINEKVNLNEENLEKKEENEKNENSKLKNFKNKKIFLCNFKGCLKEFNCSWILKRHFYSHLDLKNYKCLQCEKAYKTYENLNLHILNKHKKQKPYKCSFCSNKYSHRNGKI